MNLITSQGIVLQRSKHLEWDIRLKILLKKEGKILVTLKGGQRPASKLKALQTPFSVSDFQLSLAPHSVYGRMIGGKIIQSHPRIQMDIGRFSVAARMCEVVDLLFPYRAACPDTYQILLETLHLVQDSKVPLAKWTFFLIKVLKVLGHGDYVPDIIKFMSPLEKERFQTWFQHLDARTIDFPDFSKMTLQRCAAFIEGRLQLLLPRKLRSDIFSDLVVTQ